MKICGKNKKACQIFRDAIERAEKTKLSCTFRDFPNGSCGSTCYILGEYLRKLGFGHAEYVCGIRNEFSHAWLELDGLIIDITSDQFVDGNGKVYVGLKNDFYKSFREEFRHLNELEGEDYENLKYINNLIFNES